MNVCLANIPRNTSLCETSSFVNLNNILKKLYSDSNCTWFFEDTRTLVANLDLIFTNLTLLARGTCTDGNATDFLQKFLLLLIHVLNKWKSFSQNKDKLDQKRLCDILWIIVNNCETGVYISSVNAIVKEILENYATNVEKELFMDLFRKCFQDSIASRQFIEVCLLILTALKLEMYTEVISAKDWILAEFGFFVKPDEIPSCNTLLPLQCINEFYGVSLYRPEISEKLFPHTYSILILSCNSECGKGCRNILTQMVKDFAVKNSTPWYQHYSCLSSVIQTLPDNLKLWCNPKNDVFFVIALMVSNHCENYLSVLWPCEQIVNAIIERVKQLDFIIPPVLKAMCFFFPLYLVKYKAIHRRSETASCRLINRLETTTSFYQIITPFEGQLIWILQSSASEKVKFLLLEAWLIEDNQARILIKVLKYYCLEDVLLEYIKRFPRKSLSKKAAILVSQIQTTSTLSKKITMTFFQNLNCIDLCSNLLLAKPAIPSDPDQSLVFCVALGIILPHLQDKDSFIATCSLSCTLLINLNASKPSAMMEFCKNIGNIKVLFGAAISPDDDVGTSALCLLQTLLNFQIYNKLKFTDPLLVNLSWLIKGNDSRKKLALHFIQSILRFREENLYLDYSDDILLSLYQKLHEFCGTELADVAYDCMWKMLNTNPQYLSYSVFTYSLMVMQWSCPQPCADSSAFLEFAKLWFGLVEKFNIFDLPSVMKKCVLWENSEKDLNKQIQYT